MVQCVFVCRNTDVDVDRKLREVNQTVKQNRLDKEVVCNEYLVSVTNLRKLDYHKICNCSIYVKHAVTVLIVTFLSERILSCFVCRVHNLKFFRRKRLLLQTGRNIVRKKTLHRAS